jgi:uncharacterized protein YndB with AHSA1/START domain
MNTDMDLLRKPPAGNLALTIVREFKAPRELVFAAWTNPERAAEWWAPKDFVLLDCKMDAREGGAWFRRMRGPSGRISTKYGTYLEIKAPGELPGRLVFTYNTTDQDGVADPETVVTLTFEALGAKLTRFTLHHAGFDTEKLRDEHFAGWSGAADRLAAFVPQR